MIVAVGAMDDAAFQRWHAQTLVTLEETLEPTSIGQDSKRPLHLPPPGPLTSSRWSGQPIVIAAGTQPPATSAGQPPRCAMISRYAASGKALSVVVRT